MTEKTPPNIQTLRKKAAPKCWRCERSVASGPRLVVSGKWTCPDCAYELEYGEAPRPKKTRAKKQTETLFPLPEPSQDVSKRA